MTTLPGAVCPINFSYPETTCFPRILVGGGGAVMHLSFLGNVIVFSTGFHGLTQASTNSPLVLFGIYCR